MKILKITAIAALSLVLVLYLSFLFILPNIINLNNYKSDLTKIVKDTSNLEFNTENIKLKTSWNLQTKLLLDDVSIKYSNQKELIQSKQIEAGLKLLPLAILKIELAPIKISNPKLNITIDKDGRYDIEKYLNELLTKLNEQPQKTQEQTTIPIKLSNKMPDIILSNYEINLKDEVKKDELKIQGKEFKITDFILGEKIKITTQGALTLNNNQHCTYNAKILSFLPPMEENQKQDNELLIPEIKFNPIPVIKNYNFKANVDTDLKISQKDKDILLKGFLNATELNYKIKGQNIDKSFLKLAFKDSKIDINSNLYVDKNDKFNIEGQFKNGKRQSIDLKILSDKIELSDIQNVIIALTDIANIKTDINKLKLTGYMDSNFNVKSDMKKIESSGYLKIVNASIKHSDIPLTISSIKSNLDFNNNKITIKDTSALVNNAKFDITGNIDTNANADIKINANKLPLNLLYEAFAPVETKKTIKLANGTLDLNTTIKGKLDKIEPKILLDINGLKIKETSLLADIKLDTINVDLTANAKGEYKGSANAKNTLLSITNPKTTVSMPNGVINFDTKDITIIPSIITIDNSKFTLSGKIKDYTSKLNALVNIDGSYNANDILKYLPKEYTSMISTKGQIPVFAEITSDGKNTKINAQAVSNSQNYISLLDIKTLSAKPALVNLDISTDANSLKINDIGLYGLNKNIKPDKNFKNNLSNTQKIAAIEGKLSEITTPSPKMQNIKIYTPSPINASIPPISGSSLNAKADITINGSVNSPTIKGTISIPNFNIPLYKASGNDVSIDFNKDVIYAKSPKINLNGSIIAFDTEVSTNFNKYTTINNLNLSAETVDVDKLVQIMEAIPQNNVSPSASIPVIIKKGHGILTKIKSGNIILTNASGDFTLKNNLFKLTNMKTTAYNGIIVGTVDYNIPYETLKTNLQGRGLDASTALYTVSGLKDQMSGKLDFDADISMIGMTYEQQMKTLKGTVNFSVSNGQMGSLGRLEHFIYASNLISQKFASSNLNSIIQTLAPKNTGKFNYLKGHLTFANGWAQINPIHSGGPQMSLYITGSYNLLNNYAKVEILGRIAKEIVSVMGPVGDMSVSKLIGNFTQFGSGATNILNSYNAIKDATTISKIPQLVPQSTETKQFQVLIDGNVEKPTSVRSFKWIASEAEINAAKAQISTQLQNLIPSKIKEFIAPAASNTQPANQNTTTTTTQTQTSTNTTTPSVQAAGNALKEAAKNAAKEQLKNALPNFWDKIE